AETLHAPLLGRFLQPQHPGGIFLVPAAFQEFPVAAVEKLAEPAREMIFPITGDALPPMRFHVLLAGLATVDRIEALRDDGLLHLRGTDWQPQLFHEELAEKL